jgi:hypothetical protein
LNALEHHIWQTYISKEELQFEWMLYEAAIVAAKPSSERPVVYGADSWNESCALRADVILRSKGQILLVEVEETVCIHGIGQLLCYSALWNQLNPQLKIDQMLLVAVYDDERLAAAVQLYGIALVLLNELPGRAKQGQAGAAKDSGASHVGDTAIT